MAHIKTVNNSNDSWDNANAGLIAVGVFEDKSFTPMAEAINEASNGIFTDAIDLNDVKGKTGESQFFYVDGKRISLTIICSFKNLITLSTSLVPCIHSIPA